MEKVFNGAPVSVIDGIKEKYGIEIVLNNHTLKEGEVIIILIIFGFIFYALSTIILKKYKSDII